MYSIGQLYPSLHLCSHNGLRHSTQPHTTLNLINLTHSFTAVMQFLFFSLQFEFKIILTEKPINFYHFEVEYNVKVFKFDQLYSSTELQSFLVYGYGSTHAMSVERLLVLITLGNCVTRFHQPNLLSKSMSSESMLSPTAKAGKSLLLTFACQACRQKQLLYWSSSSPLPPTYP